jgi:RimJ/RimL family protein N-acetyltransferase
MRPKQPGDGAGTTAAVVETWDELHQWMQWAENKDYFTPEQMEIRIREVMASFLRRETIELLGIEISTGEPVIWCGFHDFDWQARQCDMGYWVRKSAHGRGIATEAANALLRFAFGAMEMRPVGLTHSAGNEASRRVAQKLGFIPEGILRSANPLPGGRVADRYCYARFDLSSLPELDVQWGQP